ncbi:MAG: glutamine--fructose-6-phosphate transaminase (isomerizing) [Defluviitaleaceae bacterium]|nr:glutamine--fructose-6-phosphate transaminase (isomerizing) [Defluviitaleaceae bacterium]MCL2274539.1 glutamine--fructose-6-phosphate transaminase (isomerizing) [Defluviitaleaceae bacterium]
MCGIIGYIGNEDAVPIIVEGLKKLEYRGYDSAGVAVLNDGRFDVIKKKGRLAALEVEIQNTAQNATPIHGHLGIGHTRWATHGEPSNENAHPHLGNQEKIAVVHNGIIENYHTLRARLQSKGIVFQSETDSEVIPQLAEYYYEAENNLFDTVIKVASRLEGSYALGFMCVDTPDTIIAIKKDNPLIIGVSEHGNFIASDIPAVLKHTNQVYYLNDNELAVLTKEGITFYDTDKERIHKEIETITWSMESAEKGGYEHFMLKEIMEQPMILKNTLAKTLSQPPVDITRFNRIIITACGSAYNAGVVARYVFEKLCRTPVEVELASEFRYKDAIIDEKSLVILVSQSGETADTIAAMREAKAAGASTLAIVNVVGSTIAKECDYCFFTAAGPEIAVATTKAFSAQLLVLYSLAIRFAAQLNKISPAEEKSLRAELEALPDKVNALFAHTEEIQKYAASCIGYKSIFFIGRNIDYAIALEGSLKLKEISYIHSEAYAGGELKHGTIALIEENTLVVAISTCKRLEAKIMSNVEQVASRGANILSIGARHATASAVIPLPETHELFTPSLSVVVLQLFSYYVAANKGLDIDKPRNLAKSVTVE